jgi:hypothetical protein
LSFGISDHTLPETWVHLWICSANKVAIRQIINQALENTKKKVHKYGLNIEPNWDVRLIFLLNEQSKVIFNGHVFHEIVKGLVNT